MLLMSIALAACASPPAPATLPAAAPAAVRGDHGKLPWLEGSFEDALAQAKTQKKLLFIDFWTSW